MRWFFSRQALSTSVPLKKWAAAGWFTLDVEKKPSLHSHVYPPLRQPCPGRKMHCENDSICYSFALAVKMSHRSLKRQSRQ